MITVKEFARLATEVKSKFEEIREAKKNARRCTSQRSWICAISKIRNWDEPFRNLQRTCGPGGIVRDDSGNDAVFIEARFSCIRYFTAATVSDTISRQSGGTEPTRTLRVRTRKQEEDSLELLRLPEADRLIDLATAIAVKTPEQV